MRFNTSLLHGEYSADQGTGATTVPIYQSSAFAHKTAEELEKIFKGSEFGYLYTRLNNPTVEALEKRVAHLEKGLGAVACASGMAAITLAVMNILQSGEEIVSTSGLFGGTFSLFTQLEQFGVTTRYAKNNKVQSFNDLINDKTRAVYIETIGNPKLDVSDIGKLAELTHQRGIPLIVDNTVTTPYLVQPLAQGADIVIHSTSKYINGSGNSIGGIVIDSGKFSWDFAKFPTLREYGKFGPFAYLAKLRKGLFKDFGACLSPFNAYLNLIGLETLGLRMERACYNAGQLAGYLQNHAKVGTVNYPGLDDHPDHTKAKQQFLGRFGGLLTIRMGTKENAFKLINNLKYAANLANIGDTRTLVIHPASTIYAANTLTEKEAMGVYEDLIRISVGIEDSEDLTEDFAQALSKI
ncbi:MAG: aminotransferase class I/II-fold pyridoxal phosphate-dependent enzyme [Desulfitobacteriaceae bacterium]|nr:aminotransferase class I/II-fold pyridoxal phosphate-dependent enzyme [Desulfitobacteriaceae bacterium]MDI6913449.1 aminotransferase class I/II-fold pyridoxal phosphate-dependent enzyme [Desulfitobacteriaceae bacterium]